MSHTKCPKETQTFRDQHQIILELAEETDSKRNRELSES